MPNYIVSFPDGARPFQHFLKASELSGVHAATAYRSLCDSAVASRVKHGPPLEGNPQSVCVSLYRVWDGGRKSYVGRWVVMVNPCKPTFDEAGLIKELKQVPEDFHVFVIGRAYEMFHSFAALRESDPVIRASGNHASVVDCARDIAVDLSACLRRYEERKRAELVSKPAEAPSAKQGKHYEKETLYAADLFFRLGDVGESAEALLTEAPTACQLRAAYLRAVAKKVEPRDLVQDASDKILDHFGGVPAQPENPAPQWKARMGDELATKPAEVPGPDRVKSSDIDDEQLLKAADLFFRFGGVGESAEELLTEAPAYTQLLSACRRVLSRGATPSLVAEARERIWTYFLGVARPLDDPNAMWYGRRGEKGLAVNPDLDPAKVEPEAAVKALDEEQAAAIEAAQLFVNFGNVGRTEYDLLKVKPTRLQLDAACLRALDNGVDPEEVEIARSTIEAYRA